MEINKNSIIAVSLSAAILIGYFAVQTSITNKRRKAEQQKKELMQAENENVSEEKISDNENSSDVLISDEVVKNESSTENDVVYDDPEAIETNKYVVKFSSLGGDIVSLELKDQADTKKAKIMAKKEDVKDKNATYQVQMAENVNATNRAFALTFGTTKNGDLFNPIVNKSFKPSYMEDGEKKILTFTREFDTYILSKQYVFTENDYMFTVSVKVDEKEGFEGLGNNEQEIAYTLRSSPSIGPYYDKSDRYERRQFIAHNGTKVKKIDVTSKETFAKYDKETSWVGFGGKYFCELIVPKERDTIANVYYSTGKKGSDIANSQIFLERKKITDKEIDTYYVYVGPRNEKELNKFSSAETNGFGFEGRKIKEAITRSPILGWLEVAFKWMMQMINKLVNNWGVSIIIMTIILKLALFPLTYKSSMGTLKMQEIQPRMQAIQTKYKDNPQKMQEETAKLYQETGYNPMSGCLPMIFQMMALWAMFNLFNNYFEFRGASFIPGWIDDLSNGDSIWSWNKEIPFITGITGNCLRILPIVYLVSQLFYGKITQMGGAAAGQNQASMKFMTYGMPIIFSFMFYNAPSGLLLFWTISNILQMVQQIVINNIMKKKKAEKAGNTSNLKHFPKKGKKR